MRSSLAEDRLPVLQELLDRGLRDGALGIGMAHQYYPGADREEIFRIFQFAAKRQALIFTHVRDMSLDAMQEVIANAAATGAPLHIVHVNSSSLARIPIVLEMIGGARQQGVNISTEAYPYTAASTDIASAIFDPGWQQRLGIDYGDLQLQATTERLDRDSFAHHRARGGIVIIHMMKESWIEHALRTPFVMIASDGMPYAPGAHPRSAGTFSRVLGRYVRERGTIDLAEALARMTLLPARRLEPFAPVMARKGRLQEGADADITIFDPDRILDTATFEQDLSYSRGVRYLVVGGTLVIEEGEIIPGRFPGRAIRGRFAGEDQPGHSSQLQGEPPLRAQQLSVAH